MSSPDDSIVQFRRVPGAPRLNRRAIERFARSLREQVAGGREFTVAVMSDADIARLNAEFRGKPAATDVLSFPANEAYLGDIAISVERAAAQAAGHGHTPEDEIRILMLHGVLHLTGMDHETDSGEMARAEAGWRTRLALPSGLIERVRR